MIKPIKRLDWSGDRRVYPTFRDALKLALKALDCRVYMRIVVCAASSKVMMMMTTT